MSSRLLAVSFESEEPRRAAQFWARMLDRDVLETERGPLLVGEGTQLGLRFAPGRAAGPGPHRMHLHLTSISAAEQQQTVTTALELGASHLDVGQRPEEGHVVLADPEGNEFCVIEPDNSFLAGCGFLGELACDGGREVGVFWSAALDWPLVWDQDGETAIQAPLGGTKVAWGGASSAPRGPTAQQHFELVPTAGSAQLEADRLESLGATTIGLDAYGDVVLTDPGGTELRLLQAG